MYGQTTGLEESNQLASFSSAQIAGLQNRWTGRNRQGWSNPEYDRLVETFNNALEPDRRVDLRVQIAKLLSEEVPSIMMHYNLNPVVFVNSLQGPMQTAANATAYTAWNLHEWELR
jgi:ABC-type transport system substrate-binding protein